MFKYFQFKDTINGTNFILRYILGVATISLFAFGMGYFMALEDYKWALLFALMMSVSVVFNFATWYKRFKALYPEYVEYLMIALGVINLVQLFADKTGYLVSFIGFVYLIGTIVVTFKNSNIEKHNG